MRTRLKPGRTAEAPASPSCSRRPSQSSAARRRGSSGSRPASRRTRDCGSRPRRPAARSTTRPRRGTSAAAPCAPRRRRTRRAALGRPQQVEVDLDVEHPLHAPHVRVAERLVGVDERARPLDARTRVDDLVAVHLAAPALDLVLRPQGQLGGRRRQRGCRSSPGIVTAAVHSPQDLTNGRFSGWAEPSQHVGGRVGDRIGHRSRRIVVREPARLDGRDPERLRTRDVLAETVADHHRLPRRDPRLRERDSKIERDAACACRPRPRARSHRAARAARSRRRARASAPAGRRHSRSGRPSARRARSASISSTTAGSRRCVGRQTRFSATTKRLDRVRVRRRRRASRSSAPISAV